MKLISKEDTIKLISFNNSTNINDFVEENMQELKLLYPEKHNVIQHYIQYLNTLILPNDMELRNQFVRMSRSICNSITQKVISKTFIDGIEGLTLIPDEYESQREV